MLCPALWLIETVFKTTARAVWSCCGINIVSLTRHTARDPATPATWLMPGSRRITFTMTLLSCFATAQQVNCVVLGTGNATRAYLHPSIVYGCGPSKLGIAVETKGRQIPHHWEQLPANKSGTIQKNLSFLWTIWQIRFSRKKAELERRQGRMNIDMYVPIEVQDEQRNVNGEEEI